MKFLFSVILLFGGGLLFGQRSTYNHCSGAVFAPVEGKFSLSFLGDKKSNQTLSNNRAKSVMDYIKVKGIDTSRITSVGFGDTKPIADNGTEEGRASNRRTEFRITSVK